MNPTTRLALFLSFSGNGGVERMLLNLLPELLNAGIPVDLLTIERTPNPQLAELDHPQLRVIPLGVRHTLLAVPALTRYLKREHPTVMLAFKDRAIRTAILAKAISGSSVSLMGKLETHLSAALAHKPPLLRHIRTYPLRWFYPRLDGLIVNAQGVADDIHALSKLPTERIHVIRNPVITPRVYALSQEPVAHPWCADPTIPLILGAGRLTRQKDFTTLIAAFAGVLARRPARLLILGEGRERPALEQQIQTLGLGDHVCLIGHVDNPYAYMARSTLFALSSRWEGLPNVLAEAMALGIPVVSTQCKSGPDEILAGGSLGRLVEVGDAEALAQAMFDTLEHPLAAGVLQQAVQEYHATASSQRHLDVLGLTPGTPPGPL